MGNVNTLQTGWQTLGSVLAVPAFLFEHFVCTIILWGGVLYTNHAIAPELETSCLLVPIYK
jgi:hypothetical protein